MKYRIEGASLPIVVIDLAQGEKIITQGGGMGWMSPNMSMETVGGGIGKVLGRMISGETMFQNVYTAIDKPGMISLASGSPGSILAVDVAPDHELIVQKSAFLGCEEGVELSVYFQKKLGVGLFGGEGFIMQKLSGKGTAFVEIDGFAKEYQLKPNEEIVINTGYLAAMDGTCSMELRSVSGLKNVLFGGEGLFNTIVKGPGKVVIQSMPMRNVPPSVPRHN